jgi:hypothetical protein
MDPGINRGPYAMQLRANLVDEFFERRTAYLDDLCHFARAKEERHS